MATPPGFYNPVDQAIYSAGDFFIPARKLFKKTGFVECEPFAHYKEDNNSVYLTMFIEDI